MNRLDGDDNFYFDSAPLDLLIDGELRQRQWFTEDQPECTYHLYKMYVEKPPQDRPRLRNMIVNVTLKGQPRELRMLVDSGYSGLVMLESKLNDVYKLQVLHDNTTTVGGKIKFKTQITEPTDVTIEGLTFKFPVQLMKDIGPFDGVLGWPFLQELELMAQPGTFHISPMRNMIDFEVHNHGDSEQFNSRHIIILGEIPEKPIHPTIDKELNFIQYEENLKIEVGSRLMRIDQHGNIIQTRDGSDFIPVLEVLDNSLEPSENIDKSNRSDWMLTYSAFDNVMRQFTPSDTDPKDHFVELFRQPGNELCQKGYSQQDDAFKHTWSGKDFYGNPVFTSKFISKTLRKAIEDFDTSPDNTSFTFILPKWKSAPWWHLVEDNFDIVKEWNTGSMIFTCKPKSKTKEMKPAKNEAPTDRYFIRGTPWPVVVIRKTLRTTNNFKVFDNYELEETICESCDNCTFMHAANNNDAQASEQDINSEIQKAVESMDQRNLTIPQLNPSWQPQVPSVEDDFRDDTVFERCKVKQNNLEYLKTKGEEMNIDLIGIIKEHGQIFQDEVPTRLVPDRGSWNAQINFQNQEDAQKPICRKPYRLAPDESRALAQNLKDLLKNGTIKPSNSPWGTPVFMVPKASGGWRMACDYRELNSRLIHEAYAPPPADILFDQMGKARIFSTHDCTWGYHQLRWNQESIPKTAIRTPFGTFEFLVMNFGSTSAPAQFQRLIEGILRPLLGGNNGCVAVFLDDIIVYSNDAKQHEKHLRQVYRLLGKNRIFLRLEKCYFCNPKVKFLGWIIADGKMQADEEKLKVIHEWPTPETKTAVRSFAGYVNFFKKLIPEYAEIMAPLFDLMRDEVPNDVTEVWNEVHQNAFESIKRKLTSPPVIKIANPDLPYIVEVDASQQAIGAILSQVDPDDKKQHVVEYYSKRLSKAQRNYAPGKLELLAIIVALKHWRHYLQGTSHKFVLYTDHKPLQYMQTTKDPSRLLLRWIDFLQQFNFEVKYRKGEENPADGLSRLELKDKHPVEITDVDDLPSGMSPELFEEAEACWHFCLLANMESSQAESQTRRSARVRGQPAPPPIEDVDFTDSDFLDENISQLMFERIKTVNTVDEFFNRVKDKKVKRPQDFTISNGILYWRGNNCTALYIPAALKNLRKYVHSQCHGTATSGHFGKRKTLARIRRAYWWPGMTIDVGQWNKTCKKCLTSKRQNLSAPMQQVPHEVPAWPWQTVFLDEVSGFPESNGCNAIWVVVDKLSKMTHLIPIQKQGFTSDHLAEALFRHIFKLHGLPNKLVHDRDARLVDAAFKQLCKLAGIRQNPSTPQHPQTDSTGEATVKLTIDIVRQFVNAQQNDWYDLLPSVEFAINSAPGQTGLSPFEIVYRHQPTSADNIMVRQNLDAYTPMKKTMRGFNRLRSYGQVIHRVRRHLKNVAQAIRQPRVVVTRRTTTPRLQAGDIVFLHKSQAGVNFAQNKMAPEWVGPFKVERFDYPVATLAIPANLQIHKKVRSEFLKKMPEFDKPLQVEDEEGQSVSTDRLCVEPLKLSEPHTVVEGGDGSTVLKFQTPRGIHSAYELVLRNHFDDLLKYLQMHEPMKFDDKNIGRIVHFKSHKDVIGIVCGVTADRKEYHIGTADESMRGQYTRDAFTVPRAQSATQSSQSFQYANKSTQHSETKARRYQRQREQRFRVLELCCGKHKSFSTQFRKMYPKAEVVTVDVKAKYSPDICEDIRHWDVLSMYPQGYFDIVWVSTPCKEYSPAKTTAPRNLKEADSIALAALHILKQLQPEVWFWENPNTMLQKRSFMQHLRALRNFTSYCKYRCKFEKDTIIWSNIKLNLRQMCSVDYPCRYRKHDGKHPYTAQSGPTATGTPGITSLQAEHIPTSLCKSLVDQAVWTLELYLEP